MWKGDSDSMTILDDPLHIQFTHVSQTQRRCLRKSVCMDVGDAKTLDNVQRLPKTPLTHSPAVWLGRRFSRPSRPPSPNL
ncbi:MAG: hypothetical protein QXU87_10135 [Candidatus Caldarchaeum sp.]